MFSQNNPQKNLIERSETIPKKQNKRRRTVAVWMMGAVICACIILVAGCAKKDSERENRRFRKFTESVFCSEAASNTISLHYTLKEPQKYGIKEKEITFGTFSTEKEQILASGENMERAMKKFSYEMLSEENRMTYDILEYCMEMTRTGAGYLLYEEPLGLVSGVQTQLPVVLSEYSLETEKDVRTYLSLMQTMPEYFESLTEFEKEKAKAGLFMSDYALDTVIEQCRAFIDMKENNYLISTFVDRIKGIDELSEKEKSDYIKKNAQVMEEYVVPAYEKLMEELQGMKGSGTNEKGLCYLPEGKAYYEYLVQAGTGSGRSVEEMKSLTKQQIITDLEAMEGVLGIDSVQTAAGALPGFSSDPLEILRDLKVGIEKNFPAPPETVCNVKYVAEEMEEHLSPAFYMIPAIDDYKQNVIYVNQAHMGNELQLFTTLAHEGYPGHLYQTVYFADTKPDPVRNIFNFGGYVEGWATYAEMCSYYLTPLSKEQATLLQKNNSIILGLYTLADIGIHYDGWSRMDTVAFFSAYGIKDAATVERIYELIIGSPGNYLKYYIGYLEFLEMKKEWAAEKGESFSQKEFHEAVLEAGPAPFEILKKYTKETGEKPANRTEKAGE